MKIKNICLLILILFVALLTSCQSEINAHRYGDSDYDCIVIIGLDGAGSFFGANTPNFDEIFSESSALTHSASCEIPSYSGQNWGSFLHGVVPDKHKSTNLSIEVQRYKYHDYPSFFELARQAYPTCEMASICNWAPINYGLIEPSAKVDKDSDWQFYHNNDNDRDTTDKVLKYLDNHVPLVMFVHLGGPDDVGHSYGYGSKEHKDEITKSDTYIGEIYNKCISVANNPLFILVCDHGGTPDGHHGGSSIAELNITCAIKGSGINSSADLSVFSPKDLEAIVLTALKIEIPDTLDGKVPQGLFK